MGRRPPHKNNPPPKSKGKAQQPQQQQQQPPQQPPQTALPDPNPVPAAPPNKDCNSTTNTVADDTNNPITGPRPPINTKNCTPSTPSFPSSFPSHDDLAWSLYHSGALFEFNVKPNQAVMCWEESEESGLEHAPTRFKLAMSHLKGLHGPADSEKALNYFQLAAAQDHDESSAYVALFHLAGLHFPRSALEAYNLLHARAEAGCAPSMYWLSKIHMAGALNALEDAGFSKFVTYNVLDQDPGANLNPDNVQFAESNQHAIELLNKSAQLNFTSAQYDMISYHCFVGHVESSLDQCVHWATQYALSNPLEQFNRDKAHGMNVEIGHALDDIHGTNGRLVNYEEAEQLLRLAAAKGYAKAFNILALLYEYGKVPAAQFQDALFYIHAAVHGCSHGQFRIAFEYYKEKSYEAAARWFQLAADQNHVDSIDFLAVMYANGYNFAKDLDQAAKLYLEAAQGGSIHAQLQLAYCYFDGSGVQQSYSSAVEWFTKATNTPISLRWAHDITTLLGSWQTPAPLDGAHDINKLLGPERTAALQHSVNSAHYELGMMHLRGIHFPQSFSAGIEHLIIAAEAGDVYCQGELGSLLASHNFGGISLPQGMCDDTLSVKWFTVATTHQDDSFSLYCLGRHLRDGTGVKQDVAAAAESYRKAIDNGSHVAAYELGMLHYDGEHPHLVPKDTKEGLRLITSAAEQSYPPAQTQLGIHFHKAGNNACAEKWYTAAADQGRAVHGYNLARFYYDTPKYLPLAMTEQQRDLKMVDLLSNVDKEGLDAKLLLGQIFDTGFCSIQPDSKKSIQFFVDCINDDPDVKQQPSKAAAAACWYLGNFSESTHAHFKTSLDFTTPLEWFTFGANHGDASCQAKIAEMYFEGKGGLKQDYVLASFWVDKSFTQGNQKAAGLVGKMQHRGVFVRPPSESEEE